jgi:hypothetical protein
MKKLLKFILIYGLFLLCGCTKTVYIPTETIYKTEVRDSIIYLKDTIEVKIPEEKIVEVLPEIDTSFLETNIASSTAYLDRDNKTLHHTLENKPTSLKTVIDTVVVTKIVKEYLEKPIITEVEKEIPYVPVFAWICIIYSILSIGIKIYRLFRNVI